MFCHTFNLALGSLRRISGDVWFTSFLSVIALIGWSAAMPFFGVYLSVSRGIPLGEVGITYLLSAIFTFFSQLLGGRLIDSFGVKQVMRYGYLGTSVAAAITGYLVIINVNGILLILLYPLFNFIRGLSQPSISALVANRSVADVRTGFSMQNMAANLGFAIGPAIGGVLSEYAGYGYIFFVPCLMSLIALASTTYWFHNNDAGIVPRHQDRKAKFRLRWVEDKNLILLLILLSCIFFALGYEVTPLSLFAANFLSIRDSLLGLLFTTNGLVIVFVQLPLMRVFKRVSLIFPMIIGCVLTAGSYALIGISTSFIELWVAMVIVTIGEVALTVPSQLAVTAFSESGNRGTFQGYYFAFGNAGRSIASFIGPLSFQIFALHIAVAWYGIAMFILAVGVMLVWISPRIERDYRRKSARDVAARDQEQ